MPAVQPDPVDATGTESTDPGIDRANEEEKYPGILLIIIIMVIA